jgi:protease I
MASELSEREIAFLVANEGVEQVELSEPWQAVEKAGGRPVLVAPKGDDVQAFNHLDKGDRFPVDVTVPEADPERFDALVLPGGVANPDMLRTDDGAVRFARAFFDSGKPVAAICHAPWTLIEADVIRGRRLASWPSLKTDIRNAGGTWVDETVVVDTRGPNTLVTSRKPDDLPDFCAQAIEAFGA